MHKKPLVLLFSGLLKLSLLSLALAGAGWLTFGTPDNIKNAANESNIYTGAVDEFIESTKKEAQSSTGQDLPLDDPAITQIAKDSFSPEILSTQSESIIDSLYAWLQGDAKSPQFNIDLNEPKQKFAEGVSNYAVTKYEALPVCTLQQLRSIDPNTADPFNAPCRAPQIASSTVKDRVYSEIVSSDAFLQKTSFTVDDLPEDEQGRTVVDNLEGAPEAYNAFRLLPWILSAASLLFGLIVYTLNDDKRKAAKSIGITLVGTGVFLAIGSLIITWSFGQMNPSDGTSSNFQNSLLSILKQLTSTYNAELMKFYLTYIVLGAGILFTIRYQKRNRPDLTDNTIK